MKIKFLKKIPALALLSVLLSYCEQKVKTNTDHPSQESSTAKTAEEKTALPPKPKSAQTQIEKIDAEAFQSAQQEEKASKPIEKITDLQLVQKQLAGIVEFKEMNGYLNINKINFRNGTSTGNSDQLDECTFAAYFPTEDILLLGGGHTTDVSYNLKTGQTTYDAGNPDRVITSPGGKYRVNKVFEGQECFYHFIQEKTNDKFQKVFELDKIFKKKIGKWLCMMEKGFWTDDQTFYFNEVIQYKKTGNVYDYYKMQITERK